MRIIPLDRKREEAEILEKIRAGETVEPYETVRMRKDRQFIDISATISPTKDAAGRINGASKLARDITERKEAERALAASEIRYRRLFESAKDGILILDAETGIVVDVNPYLTTLLGYAKDSILGKSIWELGPFKDIVGSKANFAELKRDDYIRYEDKPLEASDGRKIDVEFVSNVYLVKNLKVIQCNIRDMTERNKAEETLRKSEALLKETGRLAQIGGWSFDIKTQKQAWTEEVYRIHEVDMTFAPSVTNGVTFYTPASRPIIEAAVKRAIEQGDPFDLELEFITGKGNPRWVHAIGMLDQEHGVVHGTIQDITERKRIEEALREGENEMRKLSVIVQASPDLTGIATLDGRIVFLNPEGRKILGINEEKDISSTTIPEYVHEADRERFQKQVLPGLNRDGHWDGETLFRNFKTGEPISMWQRVFFITEPESNRRVNIVTVARDITARKSLEAQFLRAQRMESVGTLAGGIAHDLNNVLGPILMVAEVLKRQVTDVEGQKLLHLLEASAQHGADLVRQVLAFARGVEGKRILLNPVHILNEIQDMMRDTFPKNIDCSYDPHRGVWTVTGDPTQLHQVFTNLCVNARDAMPNGGALKVTIENVVLDEMYAKMNPESKPGDYVMVTVADTGSGIPADIRDKIFEPFFTTKEIGKGTGLGLSTTMGILKSHGGFIRVYSEMGKGTTFKAYLPANVESEGAADAGAAEAVLPRGNGELVLVVDDEERMRTVVQSTLEQFGYRVMLAANGAEAVARYAQNQEQIAIVLTDMAMPVMNGPATIVALKAMNPNLRIIGSSGLPSDGDVAKAAVAGVKYFVPKPYTAETLLKILAKALGEPASLS